MSPTILDYGEWLGDIEIVRPITVSRSAVLYEATHQKETILLKVAHPGLENKERLKREAEFLQQMQLDGEQEEMLPTLLPAYASTDIINDPYGKIMLQGHLLYFCLFKFWDGEPLRDLLTKRPQLWVNHIGWIMANLASGIAYMNSKGRCHLSMMPSAMLIQFDESNSPTVPRVLLIDLGLVSRRNEFHQEWHPFFVPPAYTAPELMLNEQSNPSYQSDVYGLGITLYEMLVGEPAYTYKLLSDQDVVAKVQRNERVRMTRDEDVKRIAYIALQAVAQKPKKRQEHPAEFAESLLKIFGQPPKPKKPWYAKITLRRMLMTAGLLFGIAIIFLLAYTVTILFTG